MNNPIISIIVPVYKVPKGYLQQCLESLATQTCATDLEVIVVDDGSPDSEVLEICDSYADRFVILHEENSGVSVARNLGLQHAHGKWIAFVDSDDWCEPDMFEKLMKSAESAASTPDIVVCDCYVDMSSHAVVNHFYAPNSSFVWNDATKRFTLLEIMGRNKYYNPPEVAIGVPWGKLYRLGFLQQYELIFKSELKRMQDNIFNLYAFNYAMNIVYFPEPLYHYRKFEQSRSNKYSPDVIEQFEKVLNWNRKFLNSCERDDELKQGYYSRVIQSFHAYMRFWLFHPQNHLSYKQKSRILKSLMRRNPYKEAFVHVRLGQMNRELALFTLAMRMHAFYLMGVAIRIRQSRRKPQVY